MTANAGNDASEGVGARILDVGNALLSRFGQPAYTKRTGLEELVLTILSQNTNDRNRDRAFSALRQKYPTWRSVSEASVDELIDVLRPAGLAPQKAPRIQFVVKTVLSKGDESMEFLKTMTVENAEALLLSFPGVGIKTAYCTLLFSFDQPVFPMDTHVLRIFERIGILPSRYNVEKEHRRISALVPVGRQKDIHLNLLKLGRTICKPSKPRCDECPCISMCKYASESET